ncbi:MAG: M28 family peptidase [Candidatus Promineifilaceae bacterium]
MIRFALLLIALSMLIACQSTPSTSPPLVFDGDNAFQYLADQMEFGPRYPGSEGHLQLREYIVEQLTESGWEVERQTFQVNGFDAVNIIARANVDSGGDLYLLGAHYDTRARADQSLGQESTPVPGAIDGGSGVAVLLELARTLDLNSMDSEIWLAFFDVEDNGSGGIAGWDWILGSRYMADNLERSPRAMILVDMVGQQQQELFYEGNSHPELRAILWELAAELGFAESFIPQTRHTMIDDHIPFLQRGIPSVDIIDFDYAFWHTVEDTLDKASPEKLFEVGRLLQVFLETERE